MLRNDIPISEGLSSLSMPERSKVAYKLITNLNHPKNKTSQNTYPDEYWDCTWQVLDIIGKS